VGERRWYCVQAIAVAVVGLGFAGADPASKAPLAEWKLVWSDEFEGKQIDRGKWDFDIGNGDDGWGNAELEYYTNEPKNAYVQDGSLHIRAIKEKRERFDYTSARMKTTKAGGKALFEKKYGKFEFRAKLPTGKGVWPALWMMPQADKYGGWAASGEIDVMEARGQEPGKVLGTLHYGSGWPANVHEGADFVFPRGGTIADFHVYTVEWEPGEMRWYVDEKLYQTQSFWWSSSGRDGRRNGVNPKREEDLNPWPAPFDQPFYIIMNVAVGGRFLGSPDANTVFPVEMVVDYVRVYDKAGGYGNPSPRGDGKLPFAKR
jgi:beta-glucanase (GH16 family)